MKRFVLLGLGVLALVLACSSHPANQAGTRHVDVSLAKSYSSIHELAADSAMIVEGSVTQADTQTVLGDVPFNNWTVSVARVLKGSTSSQVIEVRLVAADDGPVLNVHSTYVLFLTPTPDGTAFYIVGSGAGAYEQNGSQFIRQDSRQPGLPAGASLTALISGMT